MKKHYYCGSILLAFLSACHLTPDVTSFENSGETELAKPTETQYAWHEQERIMFVCLDPSTWQGREYDNHSTPLSEINPKRLDTDQWCRAAKAWGAKEILFVAKHTGGFCWWQTETSSYGIKETAWKGGKGDATERNVVGIHRANPASRLVAKIVSLMNDSEAASVALLTSTPPLTWRSAICEARPSPSSKSSTTRWPGSAPTYRTPEAFRVAARLYSVAR